MRKIIVGLVGSLIAISSTLLTMTASQTVLAADVFIPLTPSRIMDTRSGEKVGEIDGSGAAYSLQVTGAGGVPSSGVAAVALNVTAVSTEAGDFGGFVTVYPCGTRPDASNLNFTSGQTIPNSVIAPVSSSGKVCFYVYGKAHLLADVSGYFSSGFEPLTPSRIMDTRSGEKVGEIDGSGAAYSLQVTGAGGVPSSGVAAVALNVTAVSTEAGDFGGFVTVYPCGTRPDASNLNFTSGQTIPNSVIAPVSSSGKVCFYVYGKAHLLADVSGYFSSGFEPLTPSRIMDTRSGEKVGEIDGSGAAYSLQVTGAGGVPSSGVAAVALNVTAVSTEAGDFGGFVTVYPCGTRPDASNLNFTSGQTIPNSVIAPVSSSGKVCFYVYGKAHLLADVSGYLAANSGSSSLTPNGLTFDLSGAVGVALTDDVQTRTRLTRDRDGKISAYEVGSNLLSVDENGDTRPATRSGVADISRLLVAPNQNLYVLFDERVNLADTSLSCNYEGFEGFIRWLEHVFTRVPLDTTGDGIANSYSWDTDTVEQQAPAGWYTWETYEVVYPDGTVVGNMTDMRPIPCEPPCLLGQVDTTTGYVTCIDNTLDSVWWNDWESTANPAIQFDDDGNIYYHGSGSDDDGRSWSGILRKYTVADGAVLDLVTDNVNINDFLVAGDGKVFISGSTNTTSDDWFRVLIPREGQVRPRTVQVDSSSASWMYEFPDGEVYYAGQCCGSDWDEVLKYDSVADESTTWLWPNEPQDNSDFFVEAESSIVDKADVCEDSAGYLAGDNSLRWEDEDGDGYCGGRDQYSSYWYFDADAADSATSFYWATTEGCYSELPVTTGHYDHYGRDSSGDWHSASNWDNDFVVEGVLTRERTNSMFCSEPSRLRQRLHTTIEGDVYGVVGYSWGDERPTSIGRFYPSPKLYSTSVVNAYTVMPVLDKMFLTGLNADEDYITTYLNLATDTEITLIEADEQLEVYRMSFLTTKNRLMFDGYRFEDSSYVIGYVDMASGDVVASATGGQRLVEFQLFS